MSCHQYTRWSISNHQISTYSHHWWSGIVFGCGSHYNRRDWWWSPYWDPTGSESTLQMCVGVSTCPQHNTITMMVVRLFSHTFSHQFHTWTKLGWSRHCWDDWPIEWVIFHKSTLWSIYPYTPYRYKKFRTKKVCFLVYIILSPRHCGICRIFSTCEIRVKLVWNTCDIGVKLVWILDRLWPYISKIDVIYQK